MNDQNKFIPKVFDKRRKVSDALREEIRINIDNLSIRALARKYNLARSTIEVILYPDRLVERRQRAKPLTQAPESKEVHNEYVRRYRKRRAQFVKLGKSLQTENPNEKRVDP